MGGIFWWMISLVLWLGGVAVFFGLLYLIIKTAVKNGVMEAYKNIKQQ